MRRALATAVVLLLGCGARSALEAGGAGGGSGGASPVEDARIDPGCAPADGPAIVLTIGGVPDCSAPASSGLQLLVWGPDLAALQPGASFMLGADVNSPAQGVRITQIGQSTNVTPVTAGSLSFDTLVQGVSATGSYAVTLMDGSTAQGTFSATWCPGLSTCG